MTYQYLKDLYTKQNRTDAIYRIEDMATIPFDISNTDFIRFKKEINEDKAKLQDADGNTMTAAEAKAFVATLP